MHTVSSLRSTILLILTAIALTGCGSSKPSKPVAHEAPAAAPVDDDTPPVLNPRNDALDRKQTARITVYSTPSNGMVFVDLVPVRSDHGALAMTPCEFVLPVGKYAISVEKPGGVRKTEQVAVSGKHELEFDISTSPKEFDDPSLVNAPLFEAAVGRSIPLDTLNSSGRELDPFLTADGLTIYFASDHGGMRGIYTASRPTPYHNFGESTVVPASSGADMPLSPSISDDGLMLVYAIADKSRLWQSARTDVSSPFSNKEIVRGDENSERPWMSAQLSGDALRLYWTEQKDDGAVTRAAVRSSPGKLFGKTLSFELPGHHPHLSADGLRQFSFNGERLFRSRRGTVKQPFGEPEQMLELQLEGYVASPHHRQFWVTEDEQWLIYCNYPQRAADLYIVRLSDGPGWGRQFVANPVADKMTVAKTEPEVQPTPEAKPKITVDPRTLPLAYTDHWTELSKLLTEHKSEAAVTLVRQSLKKPELGQDRQLLDWDLELAETMLEFDRDVTRAVESLKPGATIRAGGTRFEFVRAEGDVLHLKVKDKELTRKLADLTPGELVSLADSGPEKADAAKALRFGVYLYFQGVSQQSIAESWLKRAGPSGSEFYERLARRMLNQAQAELARGNVAAGMRFLDAVATVGPNTTAAKESISERSNLYDKLVWHSIGPRRWEKGEMGEFRVEGARANGSYLKSDQQYGDFELSCEWKVNGGTAMGGVFLRTSGEGKQKEKGTKIHLASDSDLKKMDRYASGALFGSTAPSANANLPEGKWNTLRIQVRGSAVQAWINDKEVLQATLDKEIPSSGYVMLDGVAGGVSYRKVLLFELLAKP